MLELWKRYLAKVPRLATAKLPAGASAEQVEYMERGFGHCFPRDVRDFFMMHQGQGKLRAPLLPPWFTMDFDELLQHWSRMGELASAGGQPPTVEGPVRPVLGCRGWIPFARDHRNSLLAFDLEPAEGGSLGQLIEIDLEGGRRVWVAAGLRQFLRARLGESLPAATGDTKLAQELEALWPRLVNRLRKDHHATYRSLLPGISAAEIARWEATLDFRLAPDVTAYFRLLGGQSEDREAQGLFRGWSPLPPAEIWSQRETMLADHGDPRHLECEGPVRKQLSNHGWLPFAHDFSGNLLCFDHDPDEEGRVGQVIELDQDSNARRLISPSITHLVWEVVDAPRFPPRGP
jgi:cell wall assembly regulator SMI1